MLFNLLVLAALSAPEQCQSGKCPARPLSPAPAIVRAPAVVVPAPLPPARPARSFRLLQLRRPAYARPAR